MKTVMDIANHQLRLFGTLQFEEVLNAVHGVCDSLWSPPALGLLVWDTDLEVFSDTFFYGPEGRELEALTEVFAGKIERGLDLSDQPFGTITPADVKPVAYPDALGPIYYVRVQNETSLTAVILLAGIGSHEPADLKAALDPYSLFLALSNAWEVRELKRENERLRSRYDDLELTNSSLEEQTRKLIRDLELKDILRHRRIEDERMLYEISAAARSSLEIHPVLQTACDKLGRKIDHGRAIILRVLANEQDSLFVSEYHHPSVEPVKEKFLTEEGQRFVHSLLSKTAPCDLSDLKLAERAGFEPGFLRSLEFQSALIVPIILRERTIGGIFLHECALSRAWSIDDLSHFGALADQLSVAVENADLHEEKKMQAVTDGLTGISNRRYFNEVFVKEFERAKRYAEPLSLAVFDLDYLKKINDTYGHSAGDDAIKAIARVLSNSSRSIDLAARYGGEEFCLLLPNTHLEESVLIAERIRNLINEAEVEGPGGISASIGVANFPLHASEPDDLFERADEALYAAKQGGRNQVRVYNVPNGHP